MADNKAEIIKQGGERQGPAFAADRLYALLTISSELALADNEAWVKSLGLAPELQVTLVERMAIGTARYKDTIMRFLPDLNIDKAELKTETRRQRYAELPKTKYGSVVLNEVELEEKARSEQQELEIVSQLFGPLQLGTIALRSADMVTNSFEPPYDATSNPSQEIIFANLVVAFEANAHKDADWIYSQVLDPVVEELLLMQVERIRDDQVGTLVDFMPGLYKDEALRRADRILQNWQQQISPHTKKELTLTNSPSPYRLNIRQPSKRLKSLIRRELATIIKPDERNKIRHFFKH